MCVAVLFYICSHQLLQCLDVNFANIAQVHIPGGADGIVDIKVVWPQKERQLVMEGMIRHSLIRTPLKVNELQEF